MSCSGRTSYVSNYCYNRVQREGLLSYDAERDLLAIAKFLIDWVFSWMRCDSNNKFSRDTVKQHCYNGQVKVLLCPGNSRRGIAFDRMCLPVCFIFISKIVGQRWKTLRIDVNVSRPITARHAGCVWLSCWQHPEMRSDFTCTYRKQVYQIRQYDKYHPRQTPNCIGKKRTPKCIKKTRRALGGAHVPPTKVFRRLTASVNDTIVKPRVAAAMGRKTI